MAFRKTSYAKVFVDESIPSFLTTPQHGFAPIITDAAPLTTLEPTSPATNQSHSAPAPSYDRRNQSLRFRPAFMGKLIAIAVGLNGALYLAFHALPSYQPSKPIHLTQPSPAPIISLAQPAEEPPIVSFSLPRTLAASDAE
jgi:hypothetical protein